MTDSISTNTPISESDARAMIRLLADTAILPGGHFEKKRFLVDGMAELIGSHCWVWTLGCKIRPNEPQTYVAFLHGGFDDRRFTHFLEAIEHPDMPAAAAQFYLALSSGQHTTMVLEEIDPDSHSIKGEVSEIWKKADIGPVILSGYPLDSDSTSTIGLYRPYDAPPFSQREKAIAHLILNEVPWLHLSGWPEDRGAAVPTLNKKQRLLLNLLLEGLPRKAAADQMSISENTVSRYAWEVFQHFGVSSQVELMKKFLLADNSH
ncbi:helix-turn-helix transcriptional regulator [Luteolibacter sp. AS25]|uniref:helix-turn-helix transcriptional regulator n=1 Tax=Luteolibacter sp. AS25 TaxID=3135776 RepID=UPI00398B2F3A